mmetsp:Transcript_27467/g.64399  ORF Transcript_27467/g.64399 Transcript_27467/m.64399 type:complete len:351 (-) Transcript_27467:562-1614(-)
MVRRSGGDDQPPRRTGPPGIHPQRRRRLRPKFGQPHRLALEANLPRPGLLHRLQQGHGHEPGLRRGPRQRHGHPQGIRRPRPVRPVHQGGGALPRTAGSHHRLQRHHRSNRPGRFHGHHGRRRRPRGDHGGCLRGHPRIGQLPAIHRRGGHGHLPERQSLVLQRHGRLRVRRRHLGILQQRKHRIPPGGLPATRFRRQDLEVRHSRRVRRRHHGERRIPRLRPEQPAALRGRRRFLGRQLELQVRGGLGRSQHPAHPTSHPQPDIRPDRDSRLPRIHRRGPHRSVPPGQLLEVREARRSRGRDRPRAKPRVHRKIDQHLRGRLHPPGNRVRVPVLRFLQRRSLLRKRRYS